VGQGSYRGGLGAHDSVHYCTASAIISRLAGSLKGVSARRLRQDFPDHINKCPWGEHFWSPFYLAGSCGGAPPTVVKEYIENQKRPD
jgi:putative transposase